MTETELAEKDNTVRFAEAQADPMAAIESLGLTDAVDELEDLFEDPVFEEWIMNPTLQALIAYRLRDQARLSSLSSFVKSKHGHYGEGLGPHADAPPCTTGRPVGG